MVNNLYGIYAATLLPESNSPYYEDELLLYRILNGERKAEKEVSDTLKSLSRSIVGRHGNGSKADEDDVAQNAFIVLWAKVKEGIIPPLTTKLSTWLYNATRWAWLQTIRTSGRQLKYESEYAELKAFFTDHTWTEEQRQTIQVIFEKALGQLKNEKHKELLRLRYVQGWQPEDIHEEGYYANARVVSVKISQALRPLKKNIIEQLKEQGLI